MADRYMAIENICYSNSKSKPSLRGARYKVCIAMNGFVWNDIRLHSGVQGTSKSQSITAFKPHC